MFRDWQYPHNPKQTHLSPAFPTDAQKKEQPRLPHSLFNLMFFSMSYVTLISFLWNKI